MDKRLDAVFPSALHLRRVNCANLFMGSGIGQAYVSIRTTSASSELRETCRVKERRTCSFHPHYICVE